MKRTVALVALTAVVSHALARSTYPILLPAIEDDLLDRHQQSGLLTSINFGSYLLGVIVVTTISGRFEAPRILRAGLGFAVVGFAVLSVAGGFWTLALGQGLAGLASAGIWMMAPAIATSAVAANRRGTVMGLLSSAMGLGIVASSQGTRLTRQATGDDALWRPTWVAASVYTAVVLVILVAALRTPPTTAIAGGISLARLRGVVGWLPLTIGYLLFGLVISSFTPFFGEALEGKGFDRAHVANLYSLFGVAAVFAAVTFGRLSDRLGRRPVLIGALAALSIASGMVVLGREPFATLAALLFGAASFTFPVLIIAYVSDHVRDRAFSNALGALTMIYSCSLLVGPVVSGTVGDSSLGFDAVFTAVAVLAALAALVFVVALPVDRTSIAVAPEEPAGVRPGPAGTAPGRDPEVG